MGTLMHVLRRSHSKGFALPTVLIASVVLLTILAVSVSATASVRTTLKAQYYTQLAQAAGDAGVAYAKACLAANGNVPLWTDEKPLTPSTNCAGEPISSGVPISALIVAGGGSGGSGTGGGGGGGGVIYANNTLSVAYGDYPVVVGAGGASPALTSPGNNGGNSSFNGLTAIGGGGGGNSGSTPQNSGKNGGSGGGGQNYTVANTYLSGSGTPGQGYAGGPLGTAAGSGGGGAGGVGFAGSGTNVGGAGGPGIQNSITGSAVYYGGGGGGAGSSDAKSGEGGLGGGSKGDQTVAAAATANTGGGGGGGWTHASARGGAGGSGIVIIRYPTGKVTATGGTITTVGNDTIHTFTSSGTFSVSAVDDTPSCPSDPRCSVAINGNVRSSFSIGRPTLDSDGKAVSINANGFVNILRSSNGSVWKTYNQNSTQAAVVPDLCSSGAAESNYGWTNASQVSSGLSFPNAGGSWIGTAEGSSSLPGPVYFHKEFTITTAGYYVLTYRGDDSARVYIDNVYKGNTTGTGSIGVTLQPGCHSIDIQVKNAGLTASTAALRATLQLDGTTKPVLSTDTSWRVAKGGTVHFSDPNYYVDTAKWTAVRDYSAPAPAEDPTALGISTTHGYSGSNYVAGYAHFRDSTAVTVTEPVEVQAFAACVTTCTVYMDGEPIFNAASSNVSYAILTLQSGSHQFAVKLNHSSGSGVSYFYMGVIRTSDSAVLTHSDATWLAADTWSSSDVEYYSYDATYAPIPYPGRSGYVNALVVAGGGGGGGNCTTCGGAGGGGAGGLRYVSNLAVSTATYSVTVGAGGAGGVGGANRTSGTKGGNSSIGSLLSATGGGYGGAQLGVPGGDGGSGGGGSGGSSPAAGSYGSGIAGQGTRGGSGTSSSSGSGGGGGGAMTMGLGGGTRTGGAGAFYLIGGGSGQYYAGGGGGGSYTTAAVGAGGIGGGGNGGNQSSSSNTGVGLPGTANTGGGGGGANGNPRGAAGGNGGSGIVIIAYPTGSLTATGGTVTTSGIFTIHTFTSSGSFTVSSINI